MQTFESMICRGTDYDIPMSTYIYWGKIYYVELYCWESVLSFTKFTTRPTNYSFSLIHVLVKCFYDWLDSKLLCIFICIRRWSSMHVFLYLSVLLGNYLLIYGLLKKSVCVCVSVCHATKVHIRHSFCMLDLSVNWSPVKQELTIATI